MGLITWMIAVVALILGAGALYIQVSGPDAIDFSQCTIVNSGSSTTVAQTTCNALCGQKKCVMGLQSRTQQNMAPISVGGQEITDFDTNSQENLIACDELAGYGSVAGTNEIESAHVNCICCG